MIMSRLEAAVQKTKTMQPAPGFRRYWAVLRLLLFLVMLLAPDFSDSEPENISAKPVQPAFASASM